MIPFFVHDHDMSQHAHLMVEVKTTPEVFEIVHGERDGTLDERVRGLLFDKYRRRPTRGNFYQPIGVADGVPLVHIFEEHTEPIPEDLLLKYVSGHVLRHTVYYDRAILDALDALDVPLDPAYFTKGDLVACGFPVHGTSTVPLEGEHAAAIYASRGMGPRIKHGTLPRKGIAGIMTRHENGVHVVRLHTPDPTPLTYNDKYSI